MSAVFCQVEDSATGRSLSRGVLSSVDVEPHRGG
jgi:hypothetical protein